MAQQPFNTASLQRVTKQGLSGNISRALSVARALGDELLPAVDAQAEKLLEEELKPLLIQAGEGLESLSDPSARAHLRDLQAALNRLFTSTEHTQGALESWSQSARDVALTLEDREANPYPSNVEDLNLRSAVALVEQYAALYLDYHRFLVACETRARKLKAVLKNMLSLNSVQAALEQ